DTAAGLELGVERDEHGWLRVVAELHARSIRPRGRLRRVERHAPCDAAHQRASASARARRPVARGTRATWPKSPSVRSERRAVQRGSTVPEPEIDFFTLVGAPV